MSQPRLKLETRLRDEAEHLASLHDAQPDLPGWLAEHRRRRRRRGLQAAASAAVVLLAVALAVAWPKFDPLVADHRPDARVRPEDRQTQTRPEGVAHGDDQRVSPAEAGGGVEPREPSDTALASLRPAGGTPDVVFGIPVLITLDLGQGEPITRPGIYVPEQVERVEFRDLSQAEQRAARLLLGLSDEPNMHGPI